MHGLGGLCRLCSFHGDGKCHLMATDQIWDREQEMCHVGLTLKILKDNVPGDGSPYHVSFSGGKDSIVLLDLVRLSGVKHAAHMALTTVDPPELLSFVRENYPGVELHRPKYSMFQLIERKGFPPMRHIPYCCSLLKKYLGKCGVILTGVRAEESQSRKKLPFVDMYSPKKLIVNPLLHWNEGQVWDWIETHQLKYPSLYDEGYSRIGCILCPKQTDGGKQMDMKRFPKFTTAYKLAFRKMIETRKRKGMGCDNQFADAETAFAWWSDSSFKVGQVALFPPNHVIG